MDVKAIVPMVFVRSVPRSMTFYNKLGFAEDNTYTHRRRRTDARAG